MRWLPLAWTSLLALACATADEVDRPIKRDHTESGERSNLELTTFENALEGTLEYEGSEVVFAADASANEQRAIIQFDGMVLEVTIDLVSQKLSEDGHGAAFQLRDREKFKALRDALAEQYPELIATPQGRMLVKTADRFGEVPVGPRLELRETFLDLAPRVAVLSGCGGDGVTCLSGTSGSSYAVFFADGVCRAEATSYGDSICRGRCGIGCNWFDNDYTWDCLDHDVCLDYSNDCDDEFSEAADDWAATVAPLCWSGNSRQQPPLAPVCGDGAVGTAEQCDDGNKVAGDGCSPTCFVELTSTTRLVINEVDYDQVGIDGAEFVEIYNGTAGQMDLSSLALLLVNGANQTEYARIQLTGSLAPKQYLVVCPQGPTTGTCASGVAVPSGTRVIHFAAASNNLQNGDPDGVALVDLNAKQIIDALSYEGEIVAAVLTGVGTFSLVEGGAPTANDNADLADAMARFPNGADSNDARVDWARRKPSPGAPNL